MKLALVGLSLLALLACNCAQRNPLPLRQAVVAVEASEPAPSAAPLPPAAPAPKPEVAVDVVWRPSAGPDPCSFVARVEAWDTSRGDPAAFAGAALDDLSYVEGRSEPLRDAALLVLGATGAGLWVVEATVGDASGEVSAVLREIDHAGAIRSHELTWDGSGWTAPLERRLRALGVGHVEPVAIKRANAEQAGEWLLEVDRPRGIATRWRLVGSRVGCWCFHEFVLTTLRL